MRKKQYLIVGNWKMNLTFKNETDFATTEYANFISLAKQTNNKIILCPSFLSLYSLCQKFKSTPIAIGAQDCSTHTLGSFTGQIPAESLHDIKCQYCIIGHSETRKSTQTTNNDIAQKCYLLLHYNILPIICIGETKEEYKQNKTKKILTEQLKPIFNKNIPKNKTICLAYEPIWSIGSGKVAPQDYLNEIFSWLADFAKQNNNSMKWKLLYGGSTTPENVLNLQKITKINGFLIGKSSLHFQELEKIVHLLK